VLAENRTRAGRARSVNDPPNLCQLCLVRQVCISQAVKYLEIA